MRWLLLAAVAVLPGIASAQARLVVVVADALSGETLPGVRVEAAHVSGITDAQGRVGWQGFDAGPVAVAVRSVGHTPLDTALVLSERAARVAVLRLQPIQLGEAVVEAEPPGNRYLRRNGFFERRASSMGVFFTGEEVQRRAPFQFSDLFTGVAGFRVQRSQGFTSLESTRRQGCRPAIIIDGTVAFDMAGQIDSVQLSGISGVEVYRGPSEVPLNFARRDMHCGAVLIWTRTD